jgi:polysaccharide export outer membrane protein
MRTTLVAICLGLSLLPLLAQAQAGGRVLTPSDVVAIRVLNQPELSMSARVEPDGTISFPYVGRIMAAGRSEDELAHAIERRLVELKILAEP